MISVLNLYLLRVMTISMIFRECKEVAYTVDTGLDIKRGKYILN